MADAGIEVVKIPPRCPQTNCFAERLELPVRTEVTDRATPPPGIALCSCVHHAAITCPRPGSGQDPAPTCARRPHQRVRTRSLKPLIRRGGRVLEPHTQAHAILAVDFAHVDTDFLRRLYLLVVIEHSRRHVHIAGITAHSIGARVTQQARNLLMDLGDHAAQFRFLIRNRDSKFTAAFDAVFADADIGITRTPVRAPRANATAERWIGTLRRDASTAS